MRAALVESASGMVVVSAEMIVSGTPAGNHCDPDGRATSHLTGWEPSSATRGASWAHTRLS